MGIDTNRIQSTHGIPGIWGGFVSIFAALAAKSTMYGDKIYHTVYFARDPDDENYSASDQAAAQFAAIVIVFALAVVFGLITGSILKSFSSADELYNDNAYWQPAPRKELSVTDLENGVIRRP